MFDGDWFSVFIIFFSLATVENDTNNFKSKIKPVIKYGILRPPVSFECF